MELEKLRHSDQVPTNAIHSKAWELAWKELHEFRFEAAAEHLHSSLRHEKEEEASFILLWKLGKKPHTRTPRLPASLRLYEAVQAKRLEPILLYLEKSETHAAYAPALLDVLIPVLKSSDFTLIENFKRTAKISLKLGLHAERVLENQIYAAKYYNEFFNDPWTKRALDELSRFVLDPESCRRLAFAYSKTDESSVRRILISFQARVEKLTDVELGSWRDGFRMAIDAELSSLEQRIRGFRFWETTPFHFESIEMIRSRVFSEEAMPEPEILSQWRLFFGAPLEEFFSNPIPASIDPDALSLWQIRVESDRRFLSEALLRFPTEERFLTLWAESQKNIISTSDPRRWPENEKESSVVRKNLERAFEKSADKLVWFDRLRESGCSQDFYEYALSRVPVPLSWISSDLKNQFLEPTTRVRAYLKERLSVVDSSLCPTSELVDLLKFLTPLEAQQVLLSRFIVADIPFEILSEDALDLFWDARDQVSLETSTRWRHSILNFLAQSDREHLSQRAWLWIKWSWTKDSFELERFGPKTFEDVTKFPWEDFLESAESLPDRSLYLQALELIPNERMKASRIRAEIQTREELPAELLQAITTIQTEFVEASLRADYLEKQKDLAGAVVFRKRELDEHPVLNERLRIAHHILNLFNELDYSDAVSLKPILLEISPFLEANAGIDSTTTRLLIQNFSRFSDWESAWKWTVMEWMLSDEKTREDRFSSFLDIAFRARMLEEAQRLLVAEVFQASRPSALVHLAIDALMDPDSVFKIKHLRREYIEKAGELFPLQKELLRARAAYDYRAVLLWKCFYDEILEKQVEQPLFTGKRKYELWSLTESVFHKESLTVFAKYWHAPFPESNEEVVEPFLEKAKRLTQRISKLYGIKKQLGIKVCRDLTKSFQLRLEPPTLYFQQTFFSKLDDEIYAAILTGFLQVVHDRDRGLYDEKRLQERFFQGMLLAGIPISKLLRFLVVISFGDGLVDSSIFQSDPEGLIQRLPFLNSILVFYLGVDFEQKFAGSELLLV